MGSECSSSAPSLLILEPVLLGFLSLHSEALRRLPSASLFLVQRISSDPEVTPTLSVPQSPDWHLFLLLLLAWTFFILVLLPMAPPIAGKVASSHSHQSTWSPTLLEKWHSGRSG